VPSFSKSIGGSDGSRDISATSQGYNRSKGLSGTPGAYQAGSGWGNGAPSGRKDQPRESLGESPTRFATTRGK
jgi:hypothetical protein